MSTHRIRLRGFWTAQPLDNGLICWSRSFGAPTFRAANETVWLIAEQLTTELPVVLNSVSLGLLKPSAPAVDITRLLQPRNRVEVMSATPIEVMFLEIRAGHESAI